MKQMRTILCLCLVVTSFANVGSGRSVTSTRFPSRLASPHTDKPKHNGKIETKYDGFSGETIVTLRKMNVNCGSFKGFGSTSKDTCVSIVASLHCPGQQMDYVRYAKLRLMIETKDWQKRHSLGARALTVVADGERLRLGQMSLVKQDVDPQQFVDVMKEVLEVSMPHQTFLKIARAAAVEMRVGQTEFNLTEKNIEALRDLAGRAGR